LARKPFATLLPGFAHNGPVSTKISPFWAIITAVSTTCAAYEGDTAMTETLIKNFASDRARVFTDWAVFSMGAVALFVAISATVVSKTGTLNANASVTEPGAARSG